VTEVKNVNNVFLHLCNKLRVTKVRNNEYFLCAPLHDVAQTTAMLL